MSELKQILESLDLNTVNLKGKEYSMVASRLEIFRKHFGFRYGIVEEILVDDGKRVLMQTRIYDRDKPEIPIGVGHAEEIRGSSLVNKTSAVENCSTSSLGRALAAAAALHGGEMASVNEIEKAQNNEKDQDEWEKIHATYMKNIAQFPSQAVCNFWFNKHKDVLKSMKTAVPRMYGEIEEHYTKKLQSLTK
mgnify:CR=1 FL=1